MTVRVWNSYGEWDTEEAYPLYIAEPVIHASPTSGEDPLEVYFYTSDDLPPLMTRSRAWFFDWDEINWPDWEDADSYLTTPSHIYEDPGTYTCLVYIKYDSNEDWTCWDTQQITVY